MEDGQWSACPASTENVCFKILYLFWYIKRHMTSTSFQLQRLASAFKTMRENRGLTQVEAGERACIPRLAVIKIEAGRETVAIGTYSKLANALGAELALVPRTRPTLEELKDFK